MTYTRTIMRAGLGLVGLSLLLVIPVRLSADEIEHLPVGVQKDGRIVVPTNQILTPAGKQITFPGRPVDLVLIDGQREDLVIVKNMRDLVVIGVKSGSVLQTLPLPQTGEKDLGFSVVGLVPSTDWAIFATDAHNHVQIAVAGSDDKYHWAERVGLAEPEVGGHAHPAGLAWVEYDSLWCTSTRGNTIQRFDLDTKKVVETVKVGVAPYMICAPRKDRLYVTNWGGDSPAEGSPQGVTSKTPVRVDARTGVANEGSVSVVGIDGGQWKQLKTIQVGGHPSGMLASSKGKFIYVANANDDTVSVIDTSSDKVVETISCRPEGRLPFGSGSNALAISPDGGTLYVANGTNNCIADVKLGRLARDVAKTRATQRVPAVPPGSQLAGLIPTGWYPGAITISADGKKLFVANVKGHGALSQPRPATAGKNSRDHLGSVSIIDVPNAEQLAKYTQQVNANNRLAYSLAGLDKPRPDARPKPVPERHGEPSVFKHVIYIIKENRTYDQVFGDMPEGNGDPRLVIFGEEVTPNHHALARQFTLLDNFYCSGVLSADGHSWTNEAYVTDYLEKSFGGFTRSYPDHGDDPLAYPKTGFLWDNALAHQRTLRNYGEFVNEDPFPKGTTWQQVYDDYKNGTQKVKITVRASLESLAPHTHPRFPWFPLLAPDVYRAKMFIDELAEFEKKGELPNLIYLTLPCDHTTGTDPGFPTPKASVADNDLALGQIVEAVTKSRFWPATCILVVEDDPQDGFDHVDGHRTVALAISPYTRRKFVDHTSYNQTGMVKTIELILGLPPMNQLDLSATAMRGCFQAEADLSGYTCLPNNIPLDQMNPDLLTLKGEALYWANKSIELNLTEGDKADEGTFNRILWHATRGYDAPYPVEFTNAYREDREEGEEED